jgi:hypothetical protein
MYKVLAGSVTLGRNIYREGSTFNGDMYSPELISHLTGIKAIEAVTVSKVDLDAEIEAEKAKLLELESQANG